MHAAAICLQDFPRWCYIIWLNHATEQYTPRGMLARLLDSLKGCAATCHTLPACLPACMLGVGVQPAVVLPRPTCPQMSYPSSSCSCPVATHCQAWSLSTGEPVCGQRHASSTANCLPRQRRCTTACCASSTFTCGWHIHAIG